MVGQKSMVRGGWRADSQQRGGCRGPLNHPQPSPTFPPPEVIVNAVIGVPASAGLRFPTCALGIRAERFLTTHVRHKDEGGALMLDEVFTSDQKNLPRTFKGRRQKS